MAQGDYSIGNQGAADVRSEMNDIFSAIATNNSGSSAPSTNFAYQWFYNTSDNTLYVRDGANSQHIAFAVFDQTNKKWSLASDVQDADLRLLTAIAFDGGHSVSVPAGWISNLGISLSSGVITLSGYDGTALSSTNKAYVVMKDVSSPGLLKSYDLTANFTHNDDAHASSSWTGNTLGLQSGVAYSSDLPLFLYLGAHNNGTTLKPFWSRSPGLSILPASGSIGYPSSAVATTQKSVWCWEDITAGDYDGNPCIMIASGTGQMSSSDDYALSAFDNSGGIGKFQEDKWFTFPVAVFGAAASTHILSNGGTAPVFATKEYFYKISTDADVYIVLNLGSDGGTDGAGAVTTLLTLPYIVNQQGSAFTKFTGPVGVRSQGGAATNQYVMFQKETANNYCTLQEMPIPSGMQNGDFSSGDRHIVGNLTYKISLNS